MSGRIQRSWLSEGSVVSKERADGEEKQVRTVDINSHDKGDSLDGVGLMG